MPHANGDETLGELADRMIRECAMWRERAMRLEMTAVERKAIAGAIEAEHGRGAWQWAETLRGLLERTA